MELKNLTVAFLGDSLTQGIGASSPERSYPAVFSRNAKLKEGLNFGLGGTRIAKQKKSFRDISEWDRDFISRVDEIPADIDCIVIMGGTNDYMHGDAELGCSSDRDEYTFYGALHSLLSKVCKRFPSAKKVFMTPPHFVEDVSPEHTHINKGHYFSEYLYAMKEVCGFYNIRVLDLHSLSGLDSKNEENKKEFYSDNVHLNDNGYKRIAERLEDYLRNINT